MQPQPDNSTGGSESRRRSPSVDISAEISEWLAQDIPGEIDRMIEAAEFSDRHGVSGTGSIGVPSEGPWAWPIAQPVALVTPDQLRAIAGKHEVAADVLLEDADQLREYATALEDRTPLGAAMLEHFGAMRAEAAHRAAVTQAERDIASADGGVLTWEAVDQETRYKLRHGGLLTIDAVRNALHTGALWDVSGIGQARYRKIASALATTGKVC